MEPHYQDPTVQRPAIFNFLARQGRNLNTKRFLNQLLVHVALSLKDESGKPHAPVTVAVNMRTLFAEFKRQELPWKMEDFKGWEGAFCDVVDQVFNEYLKQDDTYGVKSTKSLQMMIMQRLRHSLLVCLCRTNVSLGCATLLTFVLVHNLDFVVVWNTAT